MTKNTNISLNLPMVFSVIDYHEINEFEELLSTLSSKFKVVEIAFGTKEKGRCSLNLLRKLVGYRNGLYWGLVYVGRKPSKTTIEQVLFEAGLEVEHEDTEIHW